MYQSGMGRSSSRASVFSAPMLRRSLLAFGAVSAMAAPSCADKKPTAVVVAITTESKIPEDLAELAVDVKRSSSSKFDTTYLMPVDATLPGTLTLSNDDESESASDAMTVRIRARAVGSQNWLVVREAVLGFSKEKTKLLRMPLRYSCFDFPCPDDQTCLGGKCIEKPVNVETLPEFNGDEQVFPQANTCFSVSRCLGAPETVLTIDKCSFPAPAAAGKFNVIAVYTRAPDRPVVLENDKTEGYTVSGSTVVLADGVCQALSDNKIVKIQTSTRCATKSLDSAVCDKAFVKCSEEGETCSNETDCCGNSDGAVGCSRFGSTSAPAVCTYKCAGPSDCNSGCCVDTNVAGEKVCAPAEFCGGGTAGTGGTAGAAGAGGTSGTRARVVLRERAARFPEIAGVYGGAYVLEPRPS
ncbi:MAG: hypothetical protein U0165_04805 [Polyangiaceae bacterium]